MLAYHGRRDFDGIYDICMVEVVPFLPAHCLIYASVDCVTFNHSLLVLADHYNAGLILIL